MEEKSNKGKAVKITLIVVAVVLFTIAIPVVLMLFAYSANTWDNYTVKTEYGDEFQVQFDSFRVKGSVSPLNNPNPDTRFYTTVGFKPEGSDFIGLIHNDDLTVYRLGRFVFYKDKTGWHHLDSDTKKNNPKAAKAIKDAICSDTKLYNEYKQYL